MTMPFTNSERQIQLIPPMLPSVSLKEIISDETLKQQLEAIGLSKSGDLWVLALGECFSLKPEFSYLLNRVLKDFEEQQIGGINGQYKTSVSLFSGDLLTKKDNLGTPNIPKLIESVGVSVKLVMIMSVSLSIYWQVQIQLDNKSHEILEGSSIDVIQDFCKHFLDTTRSNSTVVKNWTTPPKQSWQDLIPRPSNDRIAKWLSPPPNRERDLHILQERLGLLSGERKTLEDVGQEFGITRERVRQIVHRFLGRLWHSSKKSILYPYQVRLKRLFREYGGIMTLGEVASKIDFADNLGGYSAVTATELILYCAGGFLPLNYDYEGVRGYHNDSNFTWHLSSIDSEMIESIRSTAIALIDQHLQTYTFVELVKVVSDKLGTDIIITNASLRTSQLIETDGSGLIARSNKYPTITAKAFTVLKEIGVPAHFTVITKKINERFPDHDLKPHHVANHLTNPLFRWVDRGTYGLAEWGLPEIKPRENYSFEKKAFRLALKELGQPAPISEILDHLNKATTVNPDSKFLSKPSVVLHSNPKIFVSMGYGKWGLVEWGLPPVPKRDTIELACEVLAEDPGGWLTIQEIYMEMKSRRWHGIFGSLQNAIIYREVKKPSRKIRGEELHGFNITLYGLSTSIWNEQLALERLLSD